MPQYDLYLPMKFDDNIKIIDFPGLSHSFMRENLNDIVKK